ncbi:SAM-dependent methyltransferase [Mangrovivirga sp. M17]|uniref:SAM-dependent methyltransferase n=1 Tax=Mangrovivirga halotolerans TaxID=2993936 RepID=A0ABT3RRY8_9BACT|nr:SAM-dependent methyltransferase [Mangrovivirga halotolerans]MCX2744551.1 SAM-dependent methyltransferase [Mangrovivirga halotolerans]
MKDKGTLYLLPLPVSTGEIDKSITPYERSLIKNLKFFAAENIRTARRFISSLDEGIVIEELKFFQADKKTDQHKVLEIIKLMEKGTNVGMMSEAGCPGIADPGALLVDLAHKHNIRVIPVSGPSSMFLALMSSGFNGQQFEFCGYVPVKNPDRKVKINKMEKKALSENVTQIFMDTPYRNNALFNDILANCHPNTFLSISCDITGENEFIKTMTIKNWKNQKIDLHKKPALFLFGQCL